MSSHCIFSAIPPSCSFLDNFTIPSLEFRWRHPQYQRVQMIQNHLVHLSRTYWCSSHSNPSAFLPFSATFASLWSYLGTNIYIGRGKKDIKAKHILFQFHSNAQPGYSRRLAWDSNNLLLLSSHNLKKVTHSWAGYQNLQHHRLDSMGYHSDVRVVSYTTRRGF